MAGPHQSMIGMGIGPPPVPLGSYTFNGSEAAISIAWPTGHDVNDIAILLIGTDNQPIATPAGWNVLSAIGQGTAGVASSISLQTFWRRATSSSEAAVSPADSGVVNVAAMSAFRGCDLGASPIEAALNDTSGAQNMPATTTLGPNRFIVACYANGKQPVSTNQGNYGPSIDPTLDNVVPHLMDEGFKGTGTIGLSVGAYGGVLRSLGSTSINSYSSIAGGQNVQSIFALKPAF